MGAPAAKEGDKVLGTDTHIVLVPSGGGPVPTPLPHPFSGALDGGLVATVTVAGKAAATRDSTASNQPPHTPTPPGTTFQAPPRDSATVMMASSTVLAGGKGVARSGDTARTCGDPEAPVGQVVSGGTVLVGG